MLGIWDLLIRPHSCPPQLSENVKRPQNSEIPFLAFSEQFPASLLDFEQAENQYSGRTFEYLNYNGLQHFHKLTNNVCSARLPFVTVSGKYVKYIWT